MVHYQFCRLVFTLSNDVKLTISMEVSVKFRYFDNYKSVNFFSKIILLHTIKILSCKNYHPKLLFWLDKGYASRIWRVTPEEFKKIKGGVFYLTNKVGVYPHFLSHFIHQKICTWQNTIKSMDSSAFLVSCWLLRRPCIAHYHEMFFN